MGIGRCWVTAFREKEGVYPVSKYGSRSAETPNPAQTKSRARPRAARDSRWRRTGAVQVIALPQGRSCRRVGHRRDRWTAGHHCENRLEKRDYLRPQEEQPPEERE